MHAGRGGIGTVADLFRVEAAQIKLLNDEQARELVARLCKAECRKLELPESSVTWGGDQRAPDGGVDVNVELPDITSGLGFIPRSTTIYQVKAERFPPNRIPDEVAPRGTTREFFGELSSRRGAYVIVSTRDDCSQAALVTRRAKIAQMLVAGGFGEAVHVDFYCARRLADWVEKYPSVVVWLRGVIGQPLYGWLGYGAWAYQESDVNAEYLIDDRVRVRLPNASERVDIADALRHIRSELRSPCAIRIVGLSGVGKTRFVQAIFDQRVAEGTLPPSDNNVIYCDLGDEVVPSPNRMIDDLLARGVDTVVVVDNCNPSEHSRLAHAIKQPGSKLKLITIEYDIRDDLPEDTAVYALEGVSSDTIVRLLSRRNALLSRADAYRIAEYSDGNARVAFALASTAESTGDFATLKDADLFDRLFRQKKPEDMGLLQSAEVASLLFSFDFETSGQGSETELLAEIADTTSTKFRRHMVELQERGILQKRGVWRAVLPHAIANKLASKALSYLDPASIKKVLFDNANDRVAKSLTKRLNFLQSSPQAVSIGTSILQDGGPAGWRGKTGSHVRDIFRNLASVAPGLAIQRVSEAQREDNFADGWAHTRQQYVEIVSGLAYEESNFEAAFALLIEFAVCKRNKKQNDVAQKAVCQLSQIHLSGTQAPASLRQRLVVGLLTSKEPDKRNLGFRALGAALKTGHFDFGTVPELTHRSSDYGWKPANEAEALEWYLAWLRIISDRMDMEPARIVLADHLRGLWGVVGLREHLKNLTEKAVENDGWPEGWLALKQILKWDKKRLDQPEIQEVSDLTKRIAPGSLEQRIKAFVFAKGIVGDAWEDPDDTEDDDLSFWDRLLKKVEELARHAAKEPDVIQRLLPDMMTRGGQNAFAFGRSLGQALEDADWLLADIETYARKQGTKSLSLVVFRGLLAGHSERQPARVEAFLNRAMDAELWAGRLIELQTSVHPSASGLSRIFKAIRSGDEELANLGWLLNLPEFRDDTVSVYEELIGSLIAAGPNGIRHAWRILGDVFRKDDAIQSVASGHLLRTMTDLVLSTEWKDHSLRNDFSIGPVFKALAKIAPPSTVKHILRGLLKSASEYQGYVPRDVLKYASKFFADYTAEALDALWDAVGRQPRTSLRYSMDDFGRATPSFTLKMSTDELIKWCMKNPKDRFLFASEICDLFERDQSVGRLVITEQAIRVLNAAPDQQEVIRNYVERFRPSTWSGPLSEILESRVELFDDLKGDLSLQALIEDAEQKFRDDIVEWRRFDASREKAEAQSFE